MIWATVSLPSCFCWLYRASPSLAAKNIIDLVLVLTIWWCPCVESSLVFLEDGVAMTSAFSWQNSISLVIRLGLWILEKDVTEVKNLDHYSISGGPWYRHGLSLMTPTWVIWLGLCLIGFLRRKVSIFPFQYSVLWWKVTNSSSY